MPKQQAFNLGRTIIVIGTVMVCSGTSWALAVAFIGWAMMVYGSAE
jgi:hypothetical protein